MPRFEFTDDLKEYIHEKLVPTEELVLLKDVEEHCAPRFDRIGIDDAIKEKLTNYVLLPRGYQIDGGNAVKTLGVVSFASKSSKIRRLLQRADVIPGDFDEENESSTLFQNELCKIIRCDEMKSGRTYHTIKYMLTKEGLCQVLQRAYTSTMNPENENKHHYFAATMIIESDWTTVKFISGQKAYVKATIANRLHEGHKIAMEPFYNANGIDLRHNAHAEFGKRRATIIKKVNAERKMKTEPTISKNDIAVSFTKLSFKYKLNPYMSFSEVMKIIQDVNESTQASPCP